MSEDNAPTQAAPSMPDPAPRPTTRRGFGLGLAILIVLAGAISAATYYLLLPQFDRVTALEQARTVDQTTAGQLDRDMAALVGELGRLRDGLQDDLARMDAALDDRRAALEALGAAQGDIARRMDALDRAAASGLARVDDPLALQMELAAVRKAIAQQQADFERMQADIIAQRDAAQGEFETLSATARSEIETLLTEARTQVETLSAAATEQVDAAAQQAEELRKATVAANLATTRRAALETLLAAVKTGQAYADQLGRVRELDLDPPEVLDLSAATGVPSLSALQASFPGFARTALDTARKIEAGETAGARFGSFLRSQVGVRSLTPQDGDDADAVLSRAEAALRAGDVVQVLKDIAILPEAAQADIADWVAQAEKRQAVLDAIADLSLSLNLL